MNLLRYLLVLLWVFALGCGNLAAPLPQGALECGKNNQLALVNGAITTDYPAVHRIVIKEFSSNNSGTFSIKICSGTALSDNTFLTAFHCLPNNQLPENIYIVDEEEISLDWSTQQQADLLTPDRRALEIIIADQPQVDFNDNGEAVISTESVHKDLAVLIFPDNTFTSFLPIGDRNPVSCEYVDLVGYGDTKIPATTSNVTSIKRFGRNRLPLIPQNLELPFGSTLISGWKDNNESVNLTIGSNGDSGGPLLFNGAVVGTLSIGGLINELSSDGQLNSFLSGDALNFYTSLQTPNAASIFEKTVAAGGSFQVLVLPVVPGAN